MVIHFAIAIKREFDLFIMIVLFVIGGVVGWYMQSYEMGFVVGVVLSLVLVVDSFISCSLLPLSRS
jgi:uncharacterized membrane protein (UPF0136 family)